jgi:hypothetical protein
MALFSSPNCGNFAANFMAEGQSSRRMKSTSCESLVSMCDTLHLCSTTQNKSGLKTKHFL